MRATAPISYMTTVHPPIIAAAPSPKAASGRTDATPTPSTPASDRPKTAGSLSRCLHRVTESALRSQVAERHSPLHATPFSAATPTPDRPRSR
eukprot:4406106-Pleurochrysis_carterae.AAC.5